jgi:hypothetical protein
MNRNRIVYSVVSAAAAAWGLSLTGCTIEAHPDPVVVEHRHREVVTEAPPPVVVERDRPPVIVERDRGPAVVYERGGVYRAREHSYLVARGHNKTDYNAPTHGHITVVDTNTGRIEVSRELRRGDRIAFDPDKNKAWLNGHTILDHDLNSHHVYAMYFDPD